MTRRKGAFIALGIIGALVVLVVAAVLALTQTSWGHERVRRIALSQLGKIVHGRLQIAGLDGDLLHGATLTGLVITDSAGAPFLRADSVQVGYSIGQFINKHIDLSDVRLVHPVIVLNRPPGGKWNWDRIFPRDTTNKGPSTPGYGSWVTLRNVRVVDGDVTMRSPWTPSDTLSPRVRDSIVAFALGPLGRQDIERVPNGFQRISYFRDIVGTFPLLRLEDPNDKRQIIDVAALRMIAEPMRPPTVRVTDARGRLIVLGDSLYFNNVYAALANSRLTTSGRYNINTNDLRLRLHADTVSTNDLLWIDPAIPQDGRGKMDFALDWVGPVSDYQATNASLAVAGATLAGKLGIQMSDTLVFHDTDLRFANLSTRTIAQLFPTLKSPRQGTLTGQMAATGALSGMQLDGTVAFDDPQTGVSRVGVKGMVGAAGGVFRAGDLHLSIQPLRVALARAVAPTEPLGGTLTGTAVLNGATNTRLNATGDLTYADATGTSHVVGSGAFAQGGRVPLINANLRLLPLSLATVGQFAPAAGLVGSVRGPVSLTGPMQNLTLAADLGTPEGGSIAANGTLDLASAQKGYDLTTRMHLFNARSVSTKAPTTSVSADATVRGRGTDLATLNAAATAHLMASSYDSVTVDSATVRLRAASGVLAIDTLGVRTPAGFATVAGNFGLTQGRVATLRYVVAIDSLAAISRILPTDTGVVAARPGILARRAAAARADSARIAAATEVERAVTHARAPRLVVDTPRVIPRSQFAGRIRAAGTATGNIHTFDAAGTATLDSLVALGNTVQHATATYSWKTAFTPQSSVQAQVNAVNVLAAGFALDTVMLNTGYRKPDGTVTLAIHQDSNRVYSLGAHYTLNRTQNTVRLDNVGLRFDTVTYASAGPSTIHFGPNGIDVNRFDLRTPAGRGLYVDGRIPTSGPADVRIDVTQFNIGDLVYLLQSDIPARGLVSVSARLQGTRAAPVMSGALGIEQFTYAGRETPEVHGRFDYANATLRTDLEANRTGHGAILTERGTIPINLAMAGVTGSRIPRDRAIDANIHADSLPLALIPQMTDQVTDLGGVARVNFSVRGTVNAPDVNGQVLLENGTAHIAPLGITLRDMASSIRMTRDTVVIDSLVARSGGPIRVSGGVGIRTLDAPSFALTLDARNAQVIQNDTANLHANAHFTMNGPFNDVLVAGNARILRGVVYIPNTNGKSLVGPGDPALFSVLDTAIASQRALFPVQSPFLANLRLTAGLSVNRDVFVRSTEANIELYTDNPVEISVDRGKQTFVLDGVLLTDRGEYRFQGRRFQIRQGSATFVNTPGLDPTLQATAEYDVQFPTREAIAIRILISGTLDQPKIALESDAQPPIPETDLLSYLAFGQSTNTLLQQNGNSVTTGGSGSGNVVGVGAAFAAKQVSAAALGAVTEQISGEAIRSLGLDFFDIAPADVQLDVSSFLRGTQVEFGKYLQTRTFLQAQIRPDPTSLQRPGFQITHRFGQRTGYRIEASFEPRYLPKQPSLSTDQSPITTSAFGLFLVREWRY